MKRKTGRRVHTEHDISGLQTVWHGGAALASSGFELAPRHRVEARYSNLLGNRSARSAVLPVALLLSGLLSTVRAPAQQESVAESLFRQAREDMKRGEPGEACPKLEESYRLDPSIGTLLNLGLCEQEVGHLATAWTKLRQFVDTAPANDQRLRLATRKIAELEKLLPRVHIVVAEDARQGTITLDGMELRDASFAEGLPVDPGEHIVRITMLSGESKETRFRLSVSETLELPVSRPDPLPIVQSAPPTQIASHAEAPLPAVGIRSTAMRSVPPPANTERALAYGAGVIGITGLVTSGIFGVLALTNKQTVHEHCPDHGCRDQTGLDAARAGARNETIANAGLFIGALGLASGALLFWHSGRATVAVSAGPNSASLSLVEGIP